MPLLELLHVAMRADAAGGAFDSLTCQKALPHGQNGHTGRRCGAWLGSGSASP